MSPHVVLSRGPGDPKIFGDHSVLAPAFEFYRVGDLLRHA
jgi:hypothetical protein